MPLVCCVSETHLTPDIEENEFNIDGYTTICSRSNSRHTGGVVIYVMNCLGFSIVLNDSVDYSFWSLVVEIKMLQKSVLVGALYRSPNASPAVFLQYLEDKLGDELLHKQMTVFLGDINIDWQKNSSDTRKVKNIIQSSGFKQVVTKETRKTNTSASLIDYIITNDFNMQEVQRNFPIISDHEIIGVNIEVNGEQQEIQPIYSRHLSEDNISNIITELVGKMWNYTAVDVDVIYADFITNIQEALNKFAPVNKIKPRKCCWITQDVKQIQKNRDRAYQKFCFTGLSADWERYKKYRNEVVSMIRKNKTRYYEQNIDNCKGDSKRMWRALKDLVGTKKQSTDFMEINFEHYDSSVEENFNKFFSDSLHDISESIEYRKWEGQDFNIKTNFSNFKTINLSQLKKVIFSLKNKGSSDESLNIKLVKQLFCVIGYPLLYLINTSITTGKIPGDLKTSIITPIPKVNKPKLPSEFRPVNLLPAVDKIIETIVCNQLREYFEKNHLLFAGQSGFRGRHSCESAIQYVCADWREKINNGELVIAVFVDLQRAFETIDRGILIKKLENYGVNKCSLSWIDNYLKDRFHKTKIASRVSQKKESVLGVPQGSVLGPLLFVIYINDLHRALNNCFVNLFADDTLISVSGQNYLEIVNILNGELNVLYKWLCQNRLKLNSAKTKCMVLGSAGNCKKFHNLDLTLSINDVPIEFVNEIKYLGVILDPQLNFSVHVDYLCKKLGKKIGFFSRISYCVSKWTKMLIYKTIILPHFAYCSSLLISCNKEEVRKLQVQQNKIMRILLNCSKYTPIDYMLETLNWLNVEKNIKKANLLIIYKIEHNLMPEYLNTYLRKRMQFHDYNIRSKQNYNIDIVRTSALQKTLFYEGLRSFNELTDDIKNAPNVYTFSKRLFTYLRNQS